MFRRLFVIVTVAALTLAASCAAPPPPPELPAVPGEMLVGVDAVGQASALEAVTILSSVAGEVDMERSVPELGVYLVRPSAAVTDAIRTFSALDGVAFAEPNRIYSVPDPILDTLDGASVLVNDPNAGSAQWHHAKISDPQAWQYGSGDGVVVAVADTGTDCTHPDIRCVAGYDATTRTGLASGVNSDGHGHGTHVSSTATSTGNNGVQGAGVAWSARVMPIRVLGSSGSGSLSDIAAGAVWAVDHGARVINMSLGGAGGAATLQSALQYAVARNAQVVCAAGNANNTAPSYPAAYPECISVAATDQNDRRASFSSYGSTVDVAAPGVQINASCRGGGFCGMSGTSMASPVTAGVLALLVGRGITTAQARGILENTADPLTGQTGLGRGRINALKAMQAVPAAPTLVPPPTSVIVTVTPPSFETEVGPTPTRFPGTPAPVVTPVHTEIAPGVPDCRVERVSRTDAVTGFDIVVRCVEP